MKKIYTQDMKIKLLKRTGKILLLCALVGLGITATNMITIISDQTIDSVPAFTEAISGTLLPATIGSVLGLAGLIMVLVGWWRRRPQKHATAFQSAA